MKHVAGHGLGHGTQRAITAPGDPQITDRGGIVAVSKEEGAVVHQQRGVGQGGDGVARAGLIHLLRIELPRIPADERSEDGASRGQAIEILGDGCAGIAPIVAGGGDSE